jgi:hypothetical protein
LNEDVYEEPRDAFGLSPDDWMSYLTDEPEGYTGAALLLWGLADVTGEDGVNDTTGAPLTEMLKALAGDAQALAMLTAGSNQHSVQDLSPALRNLSRRLAVAAELASRVEGLYDDGPPRRYRAEPHPAEPHHAEAKKPLALPAPKELARSRKR